MTGIHRPVCFNIDRNSGNEVIKQSVRIVNSSGDRFLYE